MNADRRPGILFLEALPTIAGGQAVLLNLVPALARDFRLAALLPDEGPLAVALRQQGVTCFFAPVGRYSLVRKSARDVARYATRLPRLVSAAARLIRRWRADVVYANSGPTFIWGTLAAQLTGRPIIWHHHNLLADGKSLRLVQAAARLPAVRRIVCVSAAAQAQLHSVHGKTVTIPNGVDTSRFRPDPVAGSRVRNQLGISHDAVVVGMVGDLIPLKRQDTLLAALPKVMAELPDLYAVFVGESRLDDAESAEYAARVNARPLDRAILLGRCEEMPAMLNAFDLLVVASERETGPLVLAEALACGVPVLSTPVGLAPGLLPPDALFPVGDEQALASRLRMWLGDPDRLRTASADARRTAEQRLSLDRFQEDVRKVIRDVLNESQPMLP